MAGHGGYRKPTNPAPVSGPGAHSQRTDGKQPQMQLPDAGYGEQQDFQSIQSGAPMAQDQASPSAAPQGQPLPANFVGLNQPTQQPQTPVTDGAQYGAGQGTDAVGQPSSNKQDAQYLSKYLPTLVRIAESDDTPPGTKQWIRAIIAQS